LEFGEGDWLTLILRWAGVWFVAATSQLWRATGGRLNSEIFKYKIGGEW
jgi:hypothetical protein